VGELEYKGRYKFPKKFVNVLWICGKEGNFKKHYISKSVETRKVIENDPSKETKTSVEIRRGCVLGLFNNTCR
jgi:hypothetical protein